MNVNERSHHRSTDRSVRVLFVPQWYPCPKDNQNRVTGTFCREHVQAAALYDNVAVLAVTQGARGWPTLGWERVEDCGVPTFYATYGQSPIPKTTLPFFYFHFRRAIRRIIREWGMPDVIHTQDALAYYAMKVMQTYRIPFVISQHWTGFMERTVDRRTVQQFQWAFARAVRVLPANKFAAADYEQYNLLPAMRWLPNALDTDVFRPSPESAKEPWLLHVSGFTAPKRFPDVVRAFSKVRAQRPRAILQVVGDGRNRPEMEALAAKGLPAGSFRFHGFLSKPELAALMRRACGFVFPSEAETFGCVLMEAMACGCPVLTTRIGGIPAVVREGDGLFVDVGNIDQIAEGMCRLLDGTHGLDMAGISQETRRRFSHQAVGRILHEEHLRAAQVGCHGDFVSGRKPVVAH